MWRKGRGEFFYPLFSATSAPRLRALRVKQVSLRIVTIIATGTVHHPSNDAPAVSAAQDDDHAKRRGSRHSLFYPKPADLL